ncbi:MAG: hypothetical protein PHI12_08185 [Dehalococcoidales bacterium]|nr:hypothetical protein [Dehalococcoidales bacterium]
MKDIVEVAERIGYCKAKLELASANKEATAIVMYEHEITILEWVLGVKSTTQLVTVLAA